MKKTFLLFVCFSSFIYLGCPGVARTRAGRVTPAETVEGPERPWIIIDYQNREEGVSIPLWVEAFLEGRNTRVEALEEFQGFFVFVAVNSGNNFTALKQWQNGFSPDLDFARLAAVRIENRFLRPLTGYPDDEYGAYYETLIRAASDFSWQGAVRQDDYWIQRQFTDDMELTDEDTVPGAPALSETYDFFVLVTIEKPVLIPQINTLLAEIRPVPPLTRDQNNTVNRVRDRFFEGF